MRLLVKNAEIITMNESSQMTVSGGCIAAKNGVITYLGKTPQSEKEFDKVIDARGGVVMPGLVNAHTHIPMTLFKGYADDLPLHRWLLDKIFPAEEKLDSEAVYWGALLACAEMIKSGTTSFADMYFFSDSVARAAIKSGMNANIARCVTGTGEDYKKRLDEAESLFREYDGECDGAIKIDFSAHAVYTCSHEAIRETAKAAEKYGAGMTVHLSETMKENRDCYSATGKSPTEILRDCGVFDNHTYAAHGVYLSGNDMEILRDSGAAVVHNPASNLKLASGVANIKELLSCGVTVCIGTDGAASNNSLNMFSEMRLAALLHKGMRLDPTLIEAHEALKMATVNGARALSRPDSGKLKVGARADFIVLDSSAPSIFPMYDPVSAAVYSACGGEVITSVIGGRAVMENRELKTIDIDEVKSNVERSLKRMKLK